MKGAYAVAALMVAGLVLLVACSGDEPAAEAAPPIDDASCYGEEEEAALIGSGFVDHGLVPPLPQPVLDILAARDFDPLDFETARIGGHQIVLVSADPLPARPTIREASISIVLLQPEDPQAPPRWATLRVTLLICTVL